MFPVDRSRRLRRSESLRRLVRQTRLHPDQLVYPLFVVEGTGVRDAIDSMPGQFRFSVDRLIDECSAAWDEGVRAVMLFGIPSRKDAEGSEAWNDEGPVQRAIRELRRQLPELLTIADVCLCEYTDHGHCGVVRDGEVLNDPSLEPLARTAVSHARAGADLVAPSDMMDGRVAAIRDALDDGGFEQIAIMSYAAKYASAFYGPFREAAGSTPAFGDRRTYQMDPANLDEALAEVGQDLEEGADIVMVKPALAYLDVVREVKRTYRVPVAAYNVSGEYAMLAAAAERGWVDRERLMMEALTSIRRAGADIVLTYHAREAARALQAGGAP